MNTDLNQLLHTRQIRAKTDGTLTLWQKLSRAASDYMEAINHKKLQNALNATRRFTDILHQIDAGQPENLKILRQTNPNNLKECQKLLTIYWNQKNFWEPKEKS